MPMPLPTPATPSVAAPPLTSLVVDGTLEGAYSIDFSRPLTSEAGGLPAFAATARAVGRGSLMAVQVQPDAPPRAGALAVLGNWTDPGLLAPLACGPATGRDGRAEWFMICAAPPGAPLCGSGLGPLTAWSEADVIACVLRPAALALTALAARGLTHRAIRPDNIFRAASGGAAVLGCAWAAPPALHQPAVCEPPYVAMCQPAGRGDGSMADDVYALGVVLLTLILGRVPMAGLSDAAVIERKLELGCFQALTAGARLPSLTADLLGGMLADDPQQRPPPSLLADPLAARSRRVAMRPHRRAAQPLLVEGAIVWNTRSLAFALARHSAAGARLLRLGVVDHWLRRGLGDTALAARLEDAARPRDARAAPMPEPVTAMRAIALLDPLAPLCWDGMMLWPDGLGPALAASPDAGAGDATKLADLVAAEAAGGWADMRPDLCDAAALRANARSQRAMLRDRSWTGGWARLRYALNPLLACRSPLVAGHAVARIGELLPALEAVASQARQDRAVPAGRELAGFVAARRLGAAERLLAAMTEATPADEAALIQLRLLAPLQAELASGPLPHLAGWLAALAAPRLDGWRNRTRRSDKLRLLQSAAPGGQLAEVLAILDNEPERQEDADAYLAAKAAVAAIDAQLADLDSGLLSRAAAARQLGQEAAGALALAALAVCAIAVAAG